MRLAILVTTAVLGLSLPALAEKVSEGKMKESLTKLVPESKVVKQDGDEFEVSTAKQTIVEVEFNRDGTVEEASGDAAVAGDVFTPGNNMITLQQAVDSLKKAGKTPKGDWSYKKSFTNGWVYEFEGVENGKDMEYAVSAKDGKIVKDNRDLL